MSKSAMQIFLAALFGAAFAGSVLVFLLTDREQTGLVSVIAILAGGLVLAAVLPQIQEFTIGLKGVQAKLREQQEEINVLKFLVSGYVTEFELAHLQQLASPDPFPYHRADAFIEELRRLWQLGLVGKLQPNWFFRGLPDTGDLKDYLAITDRGKTYLKLRGQVNADRKAGDE